MNIETWVRLLVQRFEISKDRVLGPGSEGLFEKRSEVRERMGIVRQSKERYK